MLCFSNQRRLVLRQRVLREVLQRSCDRVRILVHVTVLNLDLAVIADPQNYELALIGEADRVLVGVLQQNGLLEALTAHIDQAKDELIVVDPYKDYIDQNRIIKISTFQDRWWDFNEVKDPQTGEKTFKKDEELFFVVVPLAVTFPAELGMQAYY